MLRQFVCTHNATGEQTVVAMEVQRSRGQSYIDAARRAGYYYPADSTVHMLSLDAAAYALPFDSLPLIIRRAKP